MKNLILSFLIACFVNISSQTYMLVDRTNSGLTSDRVTKILQDNQNAYWVITAGEFDENGLMISDGFLQKYYLGTWYTFDSTNSPLTKNIVQDIAIDVNNKVLVGTTRGLYIYDGLNWSHFNTDNTIMPDNFIYKVTVDKMNRYWLGIPNFGICLFCNENWTYFNYQNSFEGIEDFNFIYPDNAGHIWVGTDYYGLYMFDCNNWHMQIDCMLNDERFHFVGMTENSDGVRYVTIQTSSGRHLIAEGTCSPFSYCNLDELNYPFAFFSYNSIVCDNNCNLYSGTSTGLFKHDLAGWKFMDGSYFPYEFNDFSAGYVDKDNNKIFCLSTFMPDDCMGLLFYNETGVIVNVAKDEEITPINYKLYQNYPNPFNPSTTIAFDIPNSSFIELSVYDVLGNEVANLVSKFMEKGRNNIVFNSEDLSSGIYIYSLKTGGINLSKKMMLIK